MGPLLILLACVLAAESAQAPGTAPAEPAGQQEPVFRTGTTWVRVDAQAGDKSGLLKGLAKEDFVVRDEGQPQPILYFGHETEPLDVLLLLDVSGSMHRHLEEMAATAREALRQLHAGDRVGVMLFSRRAEVHEELTTEFSRIEKELKEAVRERGLGSGTLINPAILAAAEYLGKQPLAQANAAGGPRPGRRAVLMVTDNLGLNYQMPDEQVIRALLEADTVFNALVFGGAGRPKEPRPGEYTNPDFTPSDVFRVADETGGEAIKAQRAGASFRDMMESMRTRYDLQYRAPEAAPGTFRRITVELSPEARKRYPRAWIRARSGYTVK